MRPAIIHTMLIVSGLGGAAFLARGIAAICGDYKRETEAQARLDGFMRAIEARRPVPIPVTVPARPMEAESDIEWALRRVQ